MATKVSLTGVEKTQYLKPKKRWAIEANCDALHTKEGCIGRSWC